jgi:hypothetical protein
MTNQTTEQVSEILARELYVRNATLHAINPLPAERAARNEWYHTLTPDKQERWRMSALLLQASLAESNLTVTWEAK